MQTAAGATLAKIKLPNHAAFQSLNALPEQCVIQFTYRIFLAILKLLAQIRQMHKGELNRRFLSRWSSEIKHLSLAKFTMSAILGVTIVGGMFVTNEQISSLLRQDVEESKKVATDSFDKLAERKERRLLTIASGIIGFYRVSNVGDDPDAFRNFVQEISQATPDLDFIIVEENGRVIQSYPSTTLSGEDASSVLGSTSTFVHHWQNRTQLLFHFSIDRFPGDQRKIVLGVEPSFFADPDEIMGDKYKANIAVSRGLSEPKTTVYQELEFGSGVEKRYDNFLPFTQEELAESIDLNIESRLRAYGADEELVLNYKVWDSSFGIHTRPLQYLSVAMGSTVAILVTFLLLKSHILSEKLRQNLDKLEEADRFKSDFINVASHELKTPIQPILSYAEMAEKGIIDKGKALEVILKEAKRLKNLANDILDLTKIEAGTLSCEMSEIDLNELLKDVAATARISIADKSDLKIELKTDSKVGLVHADANRLVQVLHVLISNAIKFTSKGAITISSKYQIGKENGAVKNCGEAKIIVTDTGTGIPEEILPRLFGKFSTMHVGEMNKNGTGLGLFIAKAIVAAHGGRIKGENNPNGVGARFEIALPIREMTEIESIPVSNKSLQAPH